MAMTQKEKLIEILARDMCDSYEHGCDGTRCFDDWCMVGVKADRLIASGVVPVVRCEHCFFYGRDQEEAQRLEIPIEEYCALHQAGFPKDGFCNYGKPKDGDKDE